MIFAVVSTAGERTARVGALGRVVEMGPAWDPAGPPLQPSQDELLARSLHRAWRAPRSYRVHRISDGETDIWVRGADGAHDNDAGGPKLLHARNRSTGGADRAELRWLVSELAPALPPTDWKPGNGGRRQHSRKPPASPRLDPSGHLGRQQILVAENPHRRSDLPQNCASPGSRCPTKSGWGAKKHVRHLRRESGTRKERAVDHQAHKCRCRRKADKASMDLRNARSQSDGQMRATTGSYLRSALCLVGQRRARSRCPRNYEQRMGSPCVSDDLPHTIPYHGGLRLSCSSRTPASYQRVACHAKSGFCRESGNFCGPPSAPSPRRRSSN